MSNKPTGSKAGLWTGSILKVLCILFLVFDAGMKVIKHPMAIEGTKQLGVSVDIIQPLGIYLMAATVFYAIPRTAVLGCLLLLPYLGGAVAVMMIAHQPGHPYIFPVVFAIVGVGAEYLRNGHLRAVLPVTR